MLVFFIFVILAITIGFYIHHRVESSEDSTRNVDVSESIQIAGSQTIEAVGTDREFTGCLLATGCKDPQRTCFHVIRPVRLDEGGVLEANKSAEEGYCLQFEKPATGDMIQCDRRFGELVTTVSGSGRLRAECRCFWPTLFDRKDASSDCGSLVHACGGTGRLTHVHTSRDIADVPPDEMIDISEFKCQESFGNDCVRPGKDPHTGLPEYVPTPVYSRTGGLCLYEDSATGGEGPAVTGRHTTAPTLAVKGDFVSTAFASSFSNAERAYVPNPCMIDAVRGGPLRKTDCRLMLTPSNIGYCEPLSETVSTVVFDDDYLPNNGGRYSNACYEFADSETDVGAYVAEYFVRPRVDDGSVAVRPPPLPVMSVEIESDKLIPEVLDALNARTTTAGDRAKKILITQAALPEDVEYVPVPFDKRTMSRFQVERNDFVFYLPTRRALLNYWAPVQPVKIPDCDRINGDRDVTGFTPKTIAAGEYEIQRQRHVVACREPDYDRRLSVVPNIDVNPLGTAYDANPTSAILRFDKSDLTVRPYWYRSYFNNSGEVRAYVSTLPSRPHPVQ